MERSKSTKEYNRWKTNKRAKYLEWKEKGTKLKTIARFRCGNEWKGNKYWEKESKKMCRLCEGGEESWHHILRECTESRTANPSEEFIMAEDGRGIE